MRASKTNGITFSCPPIETSYYLVSNVYCCTVISRTFPDFLWTYISQTAKPW